MSITICNIRRAVFSTGLTLTAGIDVDYDNEDTPGGTR